MSTTTRTASISARIGLLHLQDSFLQEGLHRRVTSDVVEGALLITNDNPNGGNEESRESGGAVAAAVAVVVAVVEAASRSGEQGTQYQVSSQTQSDAGRQHRRKTNKKAIRT